MSPVSMMMIHNPATMAIGDHAVMQQAIDMLNEVKESIINAYVIKSGLSRAKLSHLMDAETWMNANKAIELGFADGVIGESQEGKGESFAEAIGFSRRAINNALFNKIAAKYGKKESAIERAYIPESESNDISAAELRDRLAIIEKYI